MTPFRSMSLFTSFRPPPRRVSFALPLRQLRASFRLSARACTPTIFPRLPRDLTAPLERAPILQTMRRFLCFLPSQTRLPRLIESSGLGLSPSFFSFGCPLLPPLRASPFFRDCPTCSPLFFRKLRQRMNSALYTSSPFLPCIVRFSSQNEFLSLTNLSHQSFSDRTSFSTPNATSPVFISMFRPLFFLLLSGLVYFVVRFASIIISWLC